MTDPVFQSAITRVTDAVTRPACRTVRTARPRVRTRTPGAHPGPTSTSSRATARSFRSVRRRHGHRAPRAADDDGLRRADAQLLHRAAVQLRGRLDHLRQHRRDRGRRSSTIDQYDFNTGVYTQLLDLDALVPGLAGTYIGGVGSTPVRPNASWRSSAARSRTVTTTSSSSTAPTRSNRLLLDTKATTLNGAATSMPLNFSLHHVAHRSQRPLRDALSDLG